MTINKKALYLFENNRYAEAFSLFKEAVKEERNVQSLNNLAWIYLNEEENLNKAKELLEEVLLLKPQSHFPYNMLGEIALREGQLSIAEKYLKQALSLSYSNAAVHNLAITHFHLGQFEQAANGFEQIAGDSDLTRLNEVVARIQFGDVHRAKAILECWNEQADDYIGAIEAADVYIEMHCFQEARRLFEKEWKQYIVSPYIISRYAYTLMQLGEVDSCFKIINEAIRTTETEILEIQQEPYDEYWSELDQFQRIEELQRDQSLLEVLFQKLLDGYIPPFEYELYPLGGCYLFGCQQHGHTEYKANEA
ncbi:MAG: tetratricopeptide repeat protein [Lysinibacillus sp.]